MQSDVNKTQLFYDYYQQWIEVYKRGAIRDATMAKYLMTQKWVEKLVPELKVCFIFYFYHTVSIFYRFIPFILFSETRPLFLPICHSDNFPDTLPVLPLHFPSLPSVHMQQ